MVVGLGRVIVAGIVAAGVMLVTRATRPTRAQARRLVVVAAGVVVGFPLFTTLALTTTTSVQGAVITGVLPATTAVLGVIRGRERESRAFWLAAGAGVLAVLVFAVIQGAGRPTIGDSYFLLAMVCAAVGYAEGALLARELGGWQVISWALVLSLPAAGVTLAVRGLGDLDASPAAWASFAYVGVVSTYLAYFAWYSGLAGGGIARISQIQLAQPVLTLAWSVILLGETITWGISVAAIVVLLCVMATQRTREVPGSGPDTRLTSGPSTGPSRRP